MCKTQSLYQPHVLEWQKIFMDIRMPLTEPRWHDWCTHVGAPLIEDKRRKSKYGIVSMCIIGGMGATGLFEIF